MTYPITESTELLLPATLGQPFDVLSEAVRRQRVFGELTPIVKSLGGAAAYLSRVAGTGDVATIRGASDEPLQLGFTVVDTPDDVVARNLLEDVLPGVRISEQSEPTGIRCTRYITAQRVGALGMFSAQFARTELLFSPPRQGCRSVRWPMRRRASGLPRAGTPVQVVYSVSAMLMR